jgi:uncharacterized LabA/DUF88 family protein
VGIHPKDELEATYYYTALVEDQEYSPIRPLIDWLDCNGYSLVTKPAKRFTDAMGRRKIKGNMDIELAIDVLEMAEHLDHSGVCWCPHERGLGQGSMLGFREEPIH